MLRRSKAQLGAISTFVLCMFGTSASWAADVQSAQSQWTGWHFGAGVGYGMANHQLNLDLPAFASEVNFSGIGAQGALASIEAGYDYKVSDNWLIGGVLDYTYGGIATEIDASLLGINPNYTLQATHNMSALLRVGHLVNDATLLYSLVGYTRTRWEGDLEVPGLLSADYDYSTDGLTLGGGIENAISNDVTLKFEYRYTMNEAAEIFSVPQLLDLSENANVHSARVVLSYRPGVVAQGFDGREEQWTGLRAGLSGGYSMINHVLDLDAAPFAAARLSGIGGEGFLGGVELGADMLAAQKVVVGAQVGYTYSQAKTDLDANTFIGNLDYELQAKHSFDVLARAGVLTGPDVLWYGLAGWTRTRFEGDLSFSGFQDKYKYSLDGLTVGAGVEVMLSENLSWKTEYRYTDFETVDIANFGFASLDANSNVQSVRSAMSWHF